jgi:excisionase family DNA binding protein
MDNSLMNHLPASSISVPYQPNVECFQIELARPANGQKIEKLCCTYMEAAKALDVSESTVKRLVKKRELDVLSMGRSVRITMASIQRLVQSASDASLDCRADIGSPPP